MEKEIISATVNKETAEQVKKLAQEQDRSFSKMVDLLLKKALVEDK